MTREDVLAAKARAEAATGGPWMLSPPHWHRGTRGRDCKQSVHSPDGVVAVALGAQVELAYGMPSDQPPLDSIDGIFIAAARTDVPALADLALRQMDEIERLRHIEIERDGARVRSGALKQERDLLTADLAASRAAVDRVEALAKAWDGVEWQPTWKPREDGTREGPAVSGKAFAIALRAALRGEGAKDA